MSDSNDTSNIDDKRGITNDNKKNNKDYWPTLLGIVCSVLLYYLLGGLAVYICKISASNLITKYIDPTNSNIKVKPVPIFDGSPKDSQPQIYFNSIENVYPGILAFLREKEVKYEKTKESELLSRIFLFFINIFKPVLELNYKLISYFCTYINKTLSEIFIILLGPIILSIIFGILVVCTTLFGAFKWLFGLGTLLSKEFKLFEIDSTKWLDNFVSVVVLWTLLLTLVIGGIIFFPLVMFFNCLATNYMLGSFWFYEGSVDPNNMIDNITRKITEVKDGKSIEKTENYITFLLVLCGLIHTNLKILFPLLSLFVVSTTFSLQSNKPAFAWSVLVIALLVNVALWFSTFRNIEPKKTTGGAPASNPAAPPPKPASKPAPAPPAQGGGKKSSTNIFEGYNYNIAKELKRLQTLI
jgi:hypothetical protein